MKQYIYGFLWLLAILLTACNNNERDGLLPTGMLYLNVGTDQTVLTKAEVAVTNEKLKVYIINSEEDTTIYNDYISELRDKKLQLPAGTYKVAVSSNQSKDAAWETPFYAGETEVEVKAGEITNAKVVCRIANTKVSVTYSEGVSQYFTDYETLVSNSSGHLLYLRDEYRAGFFAPEKLIADLKLTNKDGNVFTLHRVFTDIKERYHYTLNFKIGEDTEGEAGADFDISVNDKAETVDVTITIKEEDLDNNSAPKLTLTGFEDNRISFKEGSVAPIGSLDIKSVNGLKYLGFKTNSEQFTVMDLVSFDLLNLQDDVKNKLDGVEFPILQPNVDANHIVLNFAKFAPHLTSINGEQIGKHIFTVYAMDSLHQETVIEFIYEVRPDIPAITKKANAFTTYAFLEGESSETSGQGFMFRKAGEGEYKKIQATAIKGEEFSTVIKSLEPDTQYEYFAVAGTEGRGGILTFKTEIGQQLTNGGFETWSGGNPNDGSDKFWSTGNNTFATLTSETNEIAVTSSTNKKAAKLQSLQAPIVNILAAGNLFTGDFEIVGTKGGKINLGRLFSSRPSKLKGYLKYTPGAVDKPGSITYPSGNKVSVKEGDPDICSIYIALSKDKYLINTTEPSTLFDMNTQRFKDLIVAYAELPSEQSVSTEGMYKPFELTLKYLQSDYSGPLYIVVVCSAGKYGDYFIGSTKSNLLLDEFTLDYQYDEKSFSN